MTEAPPQPTLNPLQLQMVAAVVARKYGVIGICAGKGSGKTAGIAFMLLALHEDRPGDAGLLLTDTAARYSSTIGRELVERLKPLGWSYETMHEKRQLPHWLSPPHHATGERTRVFVRQYYRHGTKTPDANSIEGFDVGWAVLDEAQTMHTPEVAEKAWTRLRAGVYPTLVLMGVPVWQPWWMTWAETRDGRTIRATSYANRANIPGWEDWIGGMSRAQYEKDVLGRPQPPSGAVYGQWRPHNRHPDGNLTPEGWTYDPGMLTRLAVDWGRRHPSALIIAYDPQLDADVIVAELNPEEVSTSQFAGLLGRVAVPRSRQASARGRYVLDEGVGDKAGRARNDQTLATDFDVLSRDPTEFSGRADGGIGLRLTCWYGERAERVNVPNGVEQVSRRICDMAGRRRLLVTPECWDASTRAPGVSLASAFASYTYPARGGLEPAKNGLEHPLDALRYFVCEYRWEDVVQHDPAAFREAFNPGRVAPDIPFAEMVHGEL